MMIEFDWDSANRKHLARHRVSLEEAEEAVRDPELRFMESEEVGGEERVRMVGMTVAGRILTVVFTFRAERIRVVTAFDADRTAQRIYLELKTL